MILLSNLAHACNDLPACLCVAQKHAANTMHELMCFSLQIMMASIETVVEYE